MVSAGDNFATKTHGCDHSKREQRRQHAIKAQKQPPGQPAAAMPQCWCGAPARYEVNRITSVEFVCAKHVPDGF